MQCELITQIGIMAILLMVAAGTVVYGVATLIIDYKVKKQRDLMYSRTFQITDNILPAIRKNMGKLTKDMMHDVMTETAKMMKKMSDV